MPKQPASATNISINSVALESEIDSYTLDVTQETPVTTGLGTTGPERVVANYDHSLAISGAPDFTAAMGDATLFGLIGSSGVAMAVDPTGNTAGANDPNYDSTSVVLESYQLSGSVGNRVDFSAQLRGNSALTRTVA